MYPSSKILPIPQKYFIIILCAGGIRSSCRAACSRGSAGPLWPPPWLPSYRTISTTGAAREQPAGGSPPQVTESTEYTWTITGHSAHGIHMDHHRSQSTRNTRGPPQVTEYKEHTWTTTGHRVHRIHVDHHRSQGTQNTRGPPQVTEFTENTWTTTGHRVHGIHVDHHKS